MTVSEIHDGPGPVVLLQGAGAHPCRPRGREARLCELALTATASQLAHMVSAYRAASGTRLRQDEKREATWHTGDDGMLDFRLRLPAEEATTLIAAIAAAKDQFGEPPERAGQVPRTARPTLCSTWPGPS